MRLDVACVEQKLFKTRSNAQDAIKEQRVKVNGKVIVKASYDVSDEDMIEVIASELSFVSRGGLKLYHALESFMIDIENKTVLDVGASTGGFTDVCLQKHARKVYSVDVGTSQLAEELRNHPDCICMENTNALDLKTEDFDSPIEFLCMDVSFVSIRSLIPHLLSITSDTCEYVVLIKPQFEGKKSDIGKNGIVKDKKVHIRILKEILEYLQMQGLGVLHLEPSSITGRDGNQEYLVHFNKTRNTKYFDVTKIVKAQ